MLTKERKSLILAVLRRDGRVVAKRVAEELSLSEDTIRRDLRELAAEGRLQRVHGGALPSSPAVANFSGRQTIASSAKMAIGRAAARMARAGQIIFIDGGTTAIQLARNLAPDLRATVVTHSPSIAVELVDHPHVEVELIGGRLFKHSMVAVGTNAAEDIARIRADIYFMGVTGVHLETGLTTGDAEEAAVKRLIARQAAEVVVMASSEKLGAASPFAVVALKDIDALIIDRSISDEKAQLYRDLGIDLIVAR